MQHSTLAATVPHIPLCLFDSSLSAALANPHIFAVTNKQYDKKRQALPHPLYANADAAMRRCSFLT